MEAEQHKRSKRKQDDLFNQNDNSYSSTFSSPQQRSQRHKVTAKSDRGTPTTTTTDVSSLTMESPGPSKMRKNIREKRYYQNMLNLNNKFAAWAKSEEDKLCTQIENKTLTSTFKTTFYLNNVNAYIEKAQEIRRKFYPATRDVLTFGQGESGQLGHAYTGRDLDSNQPRCVRLLRSAAIAEMECGGIHTIGVTDTGEVYTFGSNDEGQLGNVDLQTELGFTPKDVHGFIPSSEEAAVGLEKVPTWKDVKMDLGYRLNKDPKHKLDSKYEEQIVSVSAGEAHNLCLSSTGRVYFFGAYKDTDNKKFKDDTPKDDPRVYTPLTEEERKEREESSSDDVDNTNDLDDEGKEVVGTEEMVRSVPKKAPVGIQEWPIHVNSIDGRVVKIASGGSFNAVIVAKKDESTGVTSKTCYTWGISECGELSRKISKPIINPNHVETPNEPKLARYNLDVIHKEYLVPHPVQWAVGNGCDRKVEAVCCGGYHLIVVSKDIATGMTSVHSCGLNSYGQLGLGKKMAVKKMEMGREYDEYPNVNELTEVRIFSFKFPIYMYIYISI